MEFDSPNVTTDLALGQQLILVLGPLLGPLARAMLEIVALAWLPVGVAPSSRALVSGLTATVDALSMVPLVWPLPLAAPAQPQSL